MNLFLLPTLIFLAVTAAALGARKLILQILRAWAQKTETTLDDAIVNALRIPSLYWAVAIGLYVAIGTSNLPVSSIAVSFKILHALVILSITLVLANITVQGAVYAVKKAEVPIPLTGLSQAVIKGTVLVIGVMILLGTLGVSITPLLTALGIGGLAVALALQETLSNLFAGFHILAEKPVRVGDFIKLESGEEGAVTDIGWRTTRIRTLPNNLVIVPNNKLAQSIVTNYSLPEERMAVPIPIGVSYNEDPERVERVLLEEAARAAREVPGILSDPAPSVQLIPGFGDFSLNFTLVCQVREFVNQHVAEHELRKRILKRFKKEGIEIPFPTRTVYLKQEKMKE